MTTRTFSETSLALTARLPPAKRGTGYRTVSVKSYSSSSSSATDDETVEIPTDLNSREVLEFLGFDDAVGNEIFANWQASQDDEIEDWVIGFARAYVEHMGRLYNAVDEDDEWDDALKKMGMSKDMRDRILDPEFKDLRLTQSARYWVKDTINEAFYFLTTLSSRMEQRLASQAPRVNSPDSSLPPRPAIRPEQSRGARGASRGGRGGGQQRGRGGGRGGRGGGQQPLPDGRAPHPPPERVENRIMLFKGGLEARLERCFRDDRTVMFGPLQSKPPTDFHPANSTYLYLTKYHDAALMYANYAVRRTPEAKTAVLHVAVPNELLSDSREIFGNDWRDLVWSSRNETVAEENLRELPVSLRHYEESPILIGTICKNPTEKITLMSDKSQLEELRRRASSKASQYVIQSIPRQREIASACKGFVWIVPV